MVELVAAGYARVLPANPLIVSQGRASILFDLVVACVVFFATLIALEFVGAFVFAGGLDDPIPNAWVLVGQRGLLSVVMGLVLWGLLRKNAQAPASLGVRSDGVIRSIFWGLVAYVSVFGYVMGLGVLVSVVWPDVVRLMEEARRGNVARLPAMGLGVALAFSVVVSISEELLFRGLIVTRLRSLTGSWVLAVAVSSIFFAVLHIPQGGMPVAVIFGLSVILGFWMAWQGNLIVPIVAHTLFDMTSLTWMNQVMRS